MTLKDAFNLYAKGIPDNAPEIQRRETKLAFYSGVLAIVSMQMIMVDDENLTDEERALIMDSWYKESKNFVLEYAKPYTH